MKEDGNYRIKKEIRELVIFAEQNILTDPPFTKIELLSCRNLLIYLNPEIQRRLVPVFHYALNPGGLLFLGSSETISGYTDLFTALEPRWKVFKRQEPASPPPLLMEFPVRTSKPDETTAPFGPSNRLAEATLTNQVEKVLVQQFAPPSVIVNDRGDIVYIHGLTGHFLQPAPGPPTNNIFTMAREGLRMDLLSAVREAVAVNHPILHKGVQVRTNGGTAVVDVVVRKIANPEALGGLVLISFLEITELPLRRRKTKAGQVSAAEQERITELEREVQTLRNTLQSTVEEANTTNEELKSTNEELQSTNEELQSANEELETAKEETQSLNEELQTVNSELQNKVELLSQTNDDMQNLLNSTDIATLFLDNKLCIKRFTPQTKQVFKLIPGDVGRPISDMLSTLRYNQLATDAREVLRTLAFKELEVSTKDNAWYMMRILPYRTSDNVIDGVVITFADITRQKRADQRQSPGMPPSAEISDDMLHEPLVVLDAELRVVLANGAFYRMFQLSPEKAMGQSLFDLHDGQWDIPQLHQVVGDLGEQRPTVRDVEVEIPIPPGGAKVCRLNAWRIERRAARSARIFVTLEEVGQRQQPAEA
jgi:two-component system CheB/CheR fusion protein